MIAAQLCSASQSITLIAASMALGGWLSGAIFDWTGSYRAAFVNGIAWNLVNVGIVGFLLYRVRQSQRFTGHWS